MIPLTDFVSSTTASMARADIPLPCFITNAISLFNSFHRTWRWFRIGKIYANPDNFLQLAAGFSLRAAVGNTLFFRLSAVCVLIATRILDCIKEYEGLQESWVRLDNALKMRFIVPVRSQWRAASPALLSPSTLSWIDTKIRELWMLVHRIALHLLDLCKRLFILTMRIADTVEAFALKPGIINEGMNLFFVHANQWIEHLVENKDLLKEGLIANQLLIEKILQGIHSPLTADQLIRTLENALKLTEKVHSSLTDPSDGLQVFLTTCLKKWGFEFMQSLGLDSLIPRLLLPPVTPPWIAKARTLPAARHAPWEQITKPSSLRKQITFLETLKDQKGNPPALNASTQSLLALPPIPSFSLVDHETIKGAAERNIPSWKLT